MAILVDEGIDFFHRAKRNRHYKTVSHFHDVHELYYLSRGSSCYFVGNEIFTVNEGEMIFVPKGEFHKTSVERNKDAERIILVFNDEFAGEEFLKYIDEMSRDKHICFSSGDLIRIVDILNKIEKESLKKKSDYTIMQRLYLRELLILISRHRLSSEKKKTSESFVFIEKIIKYISENVDADLSLTALSAKYNVSPNHLSKQFKKVSGLLLSEYINLARVTFAEKLLQEQSIAITELASRCGFNDSNYFAAVFKKYKGITPKKYALRISSEQRG